MYRKDTWVNAKAMRSQGMSYNEIANALGINKRTAIKLCKRMEIPMPHSQARRCANAQHDLTPFPGSIIQILPMRPARPVAASEAASSGRQALWRAETCKRRP